MKLPGRAWLQFEIEKHGDEMEIRQTAIFDPVGLSGLPYWYALYPLHQLVFSGMLRGIVNSIAKEKKRIANENRRDRQPVVQKYSLFNAR